jgi:hypothetical protein
MPPPDLWVIEPSPVIQPVYAVFKVFSKAAYPLQNGLFKERYQSLKVMFFLLIEHFHWMDIFSTISVKRKNSLHNILVHISVHTSMFLIHLSSTRSVNIMIIPTTMHFLYPCRAFR